ncbi:hypothetical protein [Butyrivibrio sp. YAB3001]|nr:hypothetical protein [Butyrivibrio sp. YAB3001]SFC11209.1 hypothetical protein SAMN02910398_01532 [Butyrivibrio sp. YAB3001]
MYSVNVEMLEVVAAPQLLGSGLWQSICDFCQGFVDGFMGR